MRNILPPVFSVLLATAASSFSSTLITSEQFTSISPQLQSRIVIQQTTGTASANVRYATGSGYYTVFQTFTWTGDYGMTGLGVKLVANSNNISSTTPLSYYLRILSVESVEAGSAVTATVGDYFFELTGNYKTVDDYLYFILPDTLNLSNGGAYAFQIVAGGTYSTRLTLATAQGGTSDYAGGNGFSAGSSLALPDNDIPTTISGTPVNGYVFFATAAIPEAGSTLLLLSGLSAGTVAAYCRRR